jgi:hypothetical protein
MTRRHKSWDRPFTGLLRRTCPGQIRAAIGQFKILPAHRTVTFQQSHYHARTSLAEGDFTIMSKSHKHCLEDTSADQKTMAKSRNKTKSSTLHKSQDRHVSHVTKSKV